MKRTLPFLIFTFFLTFKSLYAQSQDKRVILFDHDKFELTNNAQIKLNETLELINNSKIAQIEILGHTDQDGSMAYNNMLSKKRATTVFNYLITNGINNNNLTVKHFGEQQPVALEDTEQNKHLNRRVEIIITYTVPERNPRDLPKPLDIPTVKEPPTSVEISPPVEFTIPKEFTIAFQTMDIDPTIENKILINAKGTKLYVPKYAFVNEKGEPISEKVTLKFREYTNSAEIAFSGIPMTYKQGNEEYYFNSSGMFEITGTANNKPTQISENSPLKIDYALAKQNPDLGFFILNEEEDNWQKINDIQPINVVGEEEQQEEMIFDDDSIVRDPEPRMRVRNGMAFMEVSRDPGHIYPKIILGLNVGRFGVYNCDQIYRLRNKVNIEAKYIDNQGNKIEQPHVLSMIDLQFNGAFSFDPNNFTCDAKGQNVLALFTKKGELYLLDQEDFKKMNIQKSGQYNFTMKNMTETIKSTADLANYLGIKM